MDNTLRDLCYLLEDEVKKIVDKQDITPDELDMVAKAVKTMAKAKEYEAMSEEHMPPQAAGNRMNSGYSNNSGRPQGYYPGGEWRAQGYYDDYGRSNRSYDMGYGYR